MFSDYRISQLVPKHKWCLHLQFNHGHSQHPLKNVSIVAVVPKYWGTWCMVECPQCLELQLFCILLPSGSITPPPWHHHPLVARYLLIKIWLPGNRIQMHVYSTYTCTCMCTLPLTHLYQWWRWALWNGIWVCCSNSRGQDGREIMVCMHLRITINTNRAAININSVGWDLYR